MELRTFLKCLQIINVTRSSMASKKAGRDEKAQECFNTVRLKEKIFLVH